MYKVVSTSQQEFEQLFAYIDKDGDDAISREEFCKFVMTKPAKGTVLKEIDETGALVPSRQANLFFSNLCTDRRQQGGPGNSKWTADDTLSEDEIRIIHTKIRAASYTKNGQDIKGLFSLWDVDKDGSLDYSEFSAAVKKLVSGITDAEFLQLCKVIDKEGTGSITSDMLEEFIDDHSKEWKRQRQKQKEETAPVNDAVANKMFVGGLRKDNNKIKSKNLKAFGNMKVSDENMEKIRLKIRAESYTAGGNAGRTCL